MADKITLPFYPTTLDCIRWSDDNVIAVGGGEKIAISTPNLQVPNIPTSLWNYTTFQANAFTRAEVPRLQPTSSKNWSVGEEESIRNVGTLEWSASGLGRYGRSVLAVLTTDHILSIWECTGRYDAGKDWRRVLILNHSLQEYYTSEDADETHRFPDVSEHERVQQRIYSFAWCPPSSVTVNEESAGHKVITPSWREYSQCMVVSTGGGDLHLYQITSPYDALEPRGSWIADRIDTLRTSAPDTHSPGVERATNGIKADSITIGPWSTAADGTSDRVATVAMLSSGRLFATKIKQAHSITDSCANRSFSGSLREITVASGTLSGPLKYLPRQHIVAMFRQDELLTVALDGEAAGIISTCHLDDRWDDFSGLAFTVSAASDLRVHVSSHLSTLTPPLPVLDDRLTRLTGEMTHWQQAVQEERNKFDLLHDCGGHVLERVWGLATSPFEDHIATCVTLHPSDAPAYVIQSAEQCTLCINKDATGTQDEVIDPTLQTRIPRYMSGEAIFLKLRSLVASGQSLEEQSGSDRSIMIRQMQSATPIAESKHTISVPDHLHAEMQELRFSIFSSDDMCAARLDNIKSLVLGIKHTANAATRTIVDDLVHAVLAITSEDLVSGSMSRSIHTVYCVVQAKLFRSNASGSSVNPPEWSESCRICAASMSFESIKWARCANMHQFPRCAMSFLAIQEAESSKQCILCKTQFLDETRVPQLQASGEPHESLARLLFQACYACPYCGGSFGAE